jgi:hypothetical protein
LRDPFEREQLTDLRVGEPRVGRELIAGRLLPVSLQMLGTPTAGS